MSLTYATLQTLCQRRTKTENDSDALTSFKADLNIAQQIVASRWSWPELYALQNISLVSGTETYSLSSDTAVLQELRIISPTANESYLQNISKVQLRKMDPVTSNSGNSVPLFWYFSEPSISASGVETKQISFYPIPNASFTVSASYKKIVNDMANQTDYPFFSGRFHQVLIDYAIWKYAEREPDPSLNPSYYQELWEEGLAAIHGYYVTQVQNILPIAGPDRYSND